MRQKNVRHYHAIQLVIPVTSLFFCSKIIALMPIRSFFTAFLLCFSPVFLFAQIDDPQAVFRELFALDGVWFMPTDRGDRLEVWEIVDDSTMTGRALRIRPENGDTVTLETLRLELRDTVITYYATARNQNNNKPVAFRLTAADYDGYVFENPNHDDPKKIRYLLLGNRELQVFTEGRRGGRTVTNEYVFEREFSPGAVEFRLRAGMNATRLNGTGNFPALSPDDKPAFGARPGWELGVQTSFKGRGGFITINAEASLTGRAASAKSAFVATPPDTFILYRRDVVYRTLWLTLAVTPEITFKRDGRFSIFAGPYFARQLYNRARGEQEPGGDNKLFDANNDFKKTDIGILAGAQYKLNFGKKDLGGILGIRAGLGLSDVDNLYSRDCDNPAFCNGRVQIQGVSLYYSINLLKL